MPRGMSRCRICGKSIPSLYREWHEKYQCLKMRFDRGDGDVVARVLSKVLPKPIKVNPLVKVEPGQMRLFEVIGVEV